MPRGYFLNFTKELERKAQLKQDAENNDQPRIKAETGQIG